jgi:membrane protein YdbS with pleckstrin-like domain
MLATLAMVLAPNGPFSGDELASMRPVLVISYSAMFLICAVCVAGAIAMLRMKPKWLAWAGTILALLPLFGPCLGLTIPLGIWLLLVLRRSDVNASFQP